jgi:hypothetical protein
MNKLLVLLGVLCCACAVYATNKDVFETGRPIISLASVGGFVPALYNTNQIPEIKIWEDGTVIVTLFPTSDKRKVLFARIKTDEITRLNDKITASGFLKFDDQYTGENAPTDMPSTCIKFWTSETESKKVCDYYNGAPEFFGYLVTYLRAMKDQVKDKAQPFYPVAGYVKAYPEANADAKTAQAYTGPKITASGVWIEDLESLVKLWDAVNNNQLLSDCPSNNFRVSVQVEDLSINEPPTKPQQQQPRVLPGSSPTTIVRFVALGLSGLMFLLGVVLLVRIVRRRRQQQQKERDDEVPMIETPSHSASVCDQPAVPQYVATQQWAGQPAYVNTTPQYMVYYMQPTQTQQ